MKKNLQPPFNIPTLPVINDCSLGMILMCVFWLDFDEDDPLAGLLSDDEDEKPRKKSLASAAQKTAKPDTNKDRPHTGPKQDDSLPASTSFSFTI